MSGCTSTTLHLQIHPQVRPNQLRSRSRIGNGGSGCRISARRRFGIGKGIGSPRCAIGAEEETIKATTVVKNGEDSLEICRVLNGMWQTSGGWGAIDRDNAVDAMLYYADAGLTTFDMADHCLLSLSLSFSFLKSLQRLQSHGRW
jgi:hypothetical protein